MTFWKSVLFGLPLLWLAINALFYWIQPRLLFFPVSEMQSTPADWGLRYEAVQLQTEDAVTLHGWWIPAPATNGLGRQPAPVLLFFHGNAGNMSHRRQSLEIFHALGLDVFIFDYRGYGLSQGRPDEQGLYKDARAAWRYLTVQRNIPAGTIVIFGRSLGGAVAVHLAAEVPAAGLILESTFSSIADMAHRVLPGMASLLVQRFRFDSSSTMPKVRLPLLLMHSPQDEMIPFANAERLYRVANEPKRLVRMQGDHNSGFMQSGKMYKTALGEFLASLVAPAHRL